MSDTPITYHCLKTANAQKLGRDGGEVGYKILADAKRERLFLTITANSGGGYFSTEITPWDAIVSSLPADPSTNFPSKVLAGACQSRTANQPSFINAVLVAEKLVKPIEQTHRYQVCGNLAEWMAAMFALEGDVYVPPVKETPFPKKPAAASEPVKETLTLRKDRKGRAGKSLAEVDHADPA